MNPSTAATWREAYRHVAERLGSQSEARWLVEEAAGGPWPDVLDAAPTERTHSRLAHLLERRVAGEPLQYVLGHWAFRNLELMVDRRVLIPRPETEQVVEVALGELDERRSRADAATPSLAADLGTGSGAIALSLATERAAVEVWATDASADALDVASANLAGAAGRAAPRVRLALGSWWNALPASVSGRLDLVVSNPPYVSSAELDDLDPAVAAWEPPEALHGGPDGLDPLRVLVAGAGRWLAPGGSLVVEIAPYQAAASVKLATAAGLRPARIERDLAGRERCLVARRPSNV